MLERILDHLGPPCTDCLDVDEDEEHFLTLLAALGLPGLTGDIRT